VAAGHPSERKKGGGGPTIKQGGFLRLLFEKKRKSWEKGLRDIGGPVQKKPGPGEK